MLTPPQPLNNTPSCRLKFWGVRGSIPTPGPSTVVIGGNTSCVEVRADGEIIVLDSGTGIRLLGKALSEEFKGQPIHLSLLISHTHWDHIQGFPYFAPAYQPENRLRIIGAEKSGLCLDATLESQMESAFFPISMHELPGNIVVEELKSSDFAVGPVRVKAFRSNHPGTALGYRLFTSGGSITYIPDHESFRHHLHQPGDSPEAREAEFLEFIKGSEVLILDSQYDQSEQAGHQGWGHGVFQEVVQFAIKANALRLFLFHHDPDHDDARIAAFVEVSRQAALAAKSPILIEAAREGLEVVL